MKKTKTNNYITNEPDFDCIQYYEIHEELFWASYESIAVGERTTLCVAESDYCYWDFDDYVKQVKDKQLDDGNDLGEMDCISEDDILQELGIVGKMVSDDIMDCFWEAEITDLCIAGNTWYTELRDYFSEHEYNNYSKYMCYRDGSGFYYCNNDSCDGCKHFGSKKVLNEQYVLWQKYVQPIDLEYT